MKLKMRKMKFDALKSNSKITHERDFFFDQISLNKVNVKSIPGVLFSKITTEDEEKKRIEKIREEREKIIINTMNTWKTVILPNWNNKKKSNIIKKLCWKGIPTNLRGQIWPLLLGNKVRITEELYKICCQRAIMATKKIECFEEIREKTIDLIPIDICRTYPNLGFFQKGGPSHDDLRIVLEAYIGYRPDVGYVQGMSFIAAMLLLQMDSFHTFICLANIFNEAIFVTFYNFDIVKIKNYCSVHEDLLELYFPDIYKYFTQLKIKTDMYLINWIMTLFTRSLSLEIAARIWDIYLCDGIITIFRVGLTIIAYGKKFLANADFENIMGYLNSPFDLEETTFFDVMQTYKIPSVKIREILKKYDLDS